MMMRVRERVNAVPGRWWRGRRGRQRVQSARALLSPQQMLGGGAQIGAAANRPLANEKSEAAEGRGTPQLVTGSLAAQLPRARSF